MRRAGTAKSSIQSIAKSSIQSITKSSIQSITKSSIQSITKSSIQSIAKLLAIVTALLPLTLLAAPHIPTPTWRELLAGDLVAKARIRWVQVAKDGTRTFVEIQGGEAYRTNPGISAEPQPLKYDLDRNRHLAQAIKAAGLPAPSKRAAREGDRVLELLGEADAGWVVVGTWTYPLKSWQKGRLAQVADELEPLMKVQVDVFGKMRTPE